MITSKWIKCGATWARIRASEAHLAVYVTFYFPRNIMKNKCIKVFSCDQAANDWFSPSVCLSVCLSVCDTFLTMFLSSYHHEIFKVKVTEVTTQLNRFRTVTPVWIHIWWRNYTYSLMLLRRGALLFFKVIRQISRSHGSKIVEFDPDWAFPDCNSSLNSPMATKCCTQLEVA